MTKQDNERKVYQVLDRKYRTHKNHLHMGKHETLLNQLAQFFLAYEILAMGNDFYSEAIFENNKGRADLINIQAAEAYEVLYSENINTFSKKLLKYPIPAQPFLARKVVEQNIKKIIKMYDLEVEP